MGYDDQKPGSSGTTAAVILLLVFVILGGVLMLGFGGWFFFRTAPMQRHAIVAEQRAVQAERKARAMAEKARLLARQMTDKADAARAQAEQAAATAAEFEREVVKPTQTDRQIVIQLDKRGKLTVDGEATDLDGLNRIMEAAVADKDATITAEVRADEECKFRHVQEVISLCQHWGVARFRIRTLDPHGAYNAPDDKDPATVIQ